MSLTGHVYFITDPKAAFAPVVLGNQSPTSGFVPWANATVSASYYVTSRTLLAVSRAKPVNPPDPGPDPGPSVRIWTATAAVRPDGSFSIPEPGLSRLETVDSVTLQVISGVPVFRTSDIPFATAKSKPLNIWVYVDKLPTSEGITAGTVSQQVNGQGLPGNTTITVGGPYGLNFSGSQGQVNINFNVSIAPDTSPALQSFLDVSINGWNINVGWPTSWFESADDVLNKIRSGIAGAGTNINNAVLARIQSILETDDGIPSQLAANFLNNEVSVTFSGVGYPTSHSWGINDTNDNTVVIVADPCIGFPRRF